MIKSFKDANAEFIFRGVRPKKGFPAGLIRPVRRKLIMLHAAVHLSDLRSPPGNRLEKLEGDREGQHSIRVNGQFRICFVWMGDGAENVEITDYH
jgi:proteic killer suppression protein